jgi:predicted ATP-grasp superfamily ATP-dependent carboligase
MAKEWILNSAMNRFQLNFKRNVGPTSESIRKCSPKTLEEWREYYFTNVKTKVDIEELGKKLYVKITEVIQSEVAELTEQDCIDYMIQLVIDRTFDGYMTEIQTVYGQLQKILGVPIEAAPDEWDRLFNVDFFYKN